MLQQYSSKHYVQYLGFIASLVIIPFSYAAQTSDEMMKAFDADLYLQQLSQDTQKVVDTKDVAHISSDMLDEYDVFCINNKYLDESASTHAVRIIQFYKGMPNTKEDDMKKRNKYFHANRYRAMACLVSIVSATFEKNGKGEEFRSRINVAAKTSSYAAIKKAYQDWSDYLQRYQHVSLKGNDDIVQRVNEMIPLMLNGIKDEAAGVNQIIAQRQASSSNERKTLVVFECVSAASCSTSYANMSGGSAYIPDGISSGQISLFEKGQGISGNYSYKVKVSKSGSDNICTGSINILDNDTYVTVSLYPDCGISSISPHR